jgi:hypothetical protein
MVEPVWYAGLSRLNSLVLDSSENALVGGGGIKLSCPELASIGSHWRWTEAFQCCPGTNSRAKKPATQKSVRSGHSLFTVGPGLGQVQRLRLNVQQKEKKIDRGFQQGDGCAEGIMFAI